MTRVPVWLPPLAVLCALGLLFALPVFVLTDGRDIADDAPELLVLVRQPFALWHSFLETGLYSRWGSFPPLLPPLFGLAVWPWLALSSDFWAIRLGVLGWTLAVQLLLLYALRVEGADEQDVRTALWIYAVVPSVWCAIAFIPQEEIYVASFGLALWLLARAERWELVPPALVLTALAAKYFLLILILPLAFASPRPLRNLIAWTALAFGVLTLYVGYHWLRFGLTPILSHMLTPEGSISVWALLWQLGIQPPLPLIRSGSVLLTGGAVLVLCLYAHQRRVPLLFSMTATLYLTLLLISITFPAYVLWAVPLALICLTRMPRGTERFALMAVLFLWGFAEWGANFFRGVGLALHVQRAAGKEAVAARVDALLGPGFPYEALSIACIVGVLLAGTAAIALLLRAGPRSRPAV